MAGNMLVIHIWLFSKPW